MYCHYQFKHSCMYITQNQTTKIVKHGVLGIREMGSFNQADINSKAQWSDQAKSEILSPDILYAGFIHSNKNCYKEDVTVQTQAELNQTITYQKSLNSPFLLSTQLFSR